jgi:hypothetical protein
MSDAAQLAERTRLAETFLQEAVFQSRAAQASSLSSGDANCGLGEKAAVVLDLSERGHELFDELWSAGLVPATLERVQAVMAKWSKLQDGLDRKRNHFMKDFRHEHGFERATYTPEQDAAWRTGMDAVNGECDDARSAAAHELLSAADTPA